MNKQILLGLLVAGTFFVSQAKWSGHTITVKNDTNQVIKVKDPSAGGNLILFEIKPGENKVIGEILRTELGLGNNRVEKKFLLDLPGNNDVVIAAKHEGKLYYGAAANGQQLTYVRVDRGPINLRMNNFDRASLFDIGGDRVAKVTWEIKELYPDVLFKIERK